MNNHIAMRGQVALERNIAASRSASTARSYAVAWTAFAAFAGPDGNTLPADPYTVGLYLSELGTRARPSTVRLHASAIAAAHKDAGLESPVGHPGVVKALEGHARLSGDAPAQSDGIDEAAFEAITEAAGVPRVTRGGRVENEDEAQFRALVDVALIGLMRDAMLRRSEAAALTWADFTLEPIDGTSRIVIRRSKTDQTGAGAVRFVSETITEALVALKIVSERKRQASMFGLSPSQICRRIAAAARQAGLQGHYSGHSPRIGMAQDLARFGVGLVALMEAGRWKSPAMPAYYTRSQAAGQGAVAQFYKGKVQ